MAAFFWAAEAADAAGFFVVVFVVFFVSLAALQEKTGDAELLMRSELGFVEDFESGRETPEVSPIQAWKSPCEG